MCCTANLNTHLTFPTVNNLWNFSGPAASPYLRETRVQTTIKNTAVSMALEALNRNDAGISNRLESINSVLREVFSFVVK